MKKEKRLTPANVSRFTWRPCEYTSIYRVPCELKKVKKTGHLKPVDTLIKILKLGHRVWLREKVIDFEKGTSSM